MANEPPKPADVKLGRSDAVAPVTGVAKPADVNLGQPGTAAPATPAEKPKTVNLISATQGRDERVNVPRAVPVSFRGNWPIAGGQHDELHVKKVSLGKQVSPAPAAVQPVAKPDLGQQQPALHPTVHVTPIKSTPHGLGLNS